MSENAIDIKKAAVQALDDKRTLEELVNNLSGSSRRTRQASASALAVVAKEKPELLVEHVSALVDALNRPEAQTRWESLDVLTLIIDSDSRACDKAVQGAETALFDEDSGPVRLAAMRFLCKLGATTDKRSVKIWPLIDEGIQCYHGDLEFPEMLGAVVDFSAGKLDPSVKEELIVRMQFDADNGHGALARRAKQIIENLS